MKISIVRNNFFVLKYLIKHSPIYVILRMMLSILNAVTTVFLDVILLRFIIEIVVSGRDLERIVYALLLFSGYILLMIVFNSYFNNIFAPSALETMNSKIKMNLYKKAASMDLTQYDTPEYYNDFILAMSSSENRLLGFLNNMDKFSGQLMNILLISAIFSSIDSGLFLLIGLSSLATLSFSSPLAKAAYQKEMDTRYFYRKRDYFTRIFGLSAYAKELRLGNVGDLFLNKFRSNNHMLEELLHKKNKKYWILNFFEVYLSGYFMISFVVVLYLGYRIMVSKTADISDFIAVFNGVNITLSAIYFLLGTFVRQLKEDGLFFEKFRGFLNYKSTIQSGKIEPDLSIQHQLQLKNVSFMYDSSKKKILKNINMTIESGQKIAIVGNNGAGKSTLAKLILRLYDPKDGEICMDHNNITDYNIDSYQNLFGTLFQDFQLFSASLAQNVSMNQGYNEFVVNETLNKSGFGGKLNSLDYGIHTILMREFDDNGVLLSGGESQKVGIARALYKKDTSFIILDEPSSALDPIAEYELNKIIMELLKDKTVIFISHRLTTVKLADQIYMLNNGEIIEHGTHKELIKLNREYAKMWHCQANNYI